MKSALSPTWLCHAKSGPSQNRSPEPLLATKSGPGTGFGNQKWPGGPVLATKSGPGGSVLATKSSPGEGGSFGNQKWSGGTGFGNQKSGLITTAKIVSFPDPSRASSRVWERDYCQNWSGRGNSFDSQRWSCLGFLTVTLPLALNISSAEKLPFSARLH